MNKMLETFFFKTGQIYIKYAECAESLKRMKNQFSDLCDFQFLRYGRFCNILRDITKLRENQLFFDEF